MNNRTTARIASGIDGKIYLVFSDGLQAEEFAVKYAGNADAYTYYCFGQYENAFLLDHVLTGPQHLDVIIN